MGTIKSEGRKKAEIRIRSGEMASGVRISDFGLLAAFGRFGLRDLLNARV